MPFRCYTTLTFCARCAPSRPPLLSFASAARLSSLVSRSLPRHFQAKAKANSSNVICIFRSTNKASSESEKAANFRWKCKQPMRGASQRERERKGKEKRAKQTSWWKFMTKQSRESVHDIKVGCMCVVRLSRSPAFCLSPALAPSSAYAFPFK